MKPNCFVIVLFDDEINQLVSNGDLVKRQSGNTRRTITPETVWYTDLILANGIPQFKQEIWLLDSESDLNKADQLDDILDAITGKDNEKYNINTAQFNQNDLHIADWAVVIDHPCK